MNPSRQFILRPVSTTLLMVALLLAGIAAAGFLPVAALPEVDFPTIQVRTFYPGASPDVMGSAVTAPLEQQLGQMAGLEQMASASAAGASVITLRFALALPLDVAEQEVQAAINAASSLLPADLPAPPVYAKFNPADAPVLTLAVVSDTLPLPRLADLADTRLAQKISQLPGVGLVSIGGGQRPALRIRANPLALAAYGLNLDDLRTTIAVSNANLPKGSLEGPLHAYTIDADDQLGDAQAFRDAVVAYRNGAAVHLSDVASVADAAENARVGAWMNTTPAVILNVRRQPGANVIGVVDSIRHVLPQLQAALPQAVRVVALTDRTVTIRASVREVALELALAAVLVVAVIHLFLRDPRATAIASLAVPLSLVGTLAFMYLAGFSLNNLSLMALTIATGFVVDDAIVMLENIGRYIEAGEAPLRAALTGARQIGFTIVSLTVSLIAVLIPLLFMGGVVGRLFHEFAMTLAAAIVISAAVSLTLVPMLAGRLPRRAAHAPRHDVLAGLRDWYGRALAWVLARQRLTLGLFAATLAATLGLYASMPLGFFPPQDTGVIAAFTQAPPDISFAAMQAHQQALAAALLRDPDVASLSSFIGVDGSNMTPGSGRMLINLRPRADRRLAASGMVRRLLRQAAGVPGITLALQPVQELTVDDSAGPGDYSLVLRNADRAALAGALPLVLDRLRRLPQLVGVASDLAAQARVTGIVIDRDTAARFGITPATVDNALYDAFGQRIVSTIFTQSNQYRVILEADQTGGTAAASLASIYLPSAAGGQVPLSAVAHVVAGRAPPLLSRIGQLPAATIYFNLAPGASLGGAVAAIRHAVAGVALGDGFSVSFGGAALAFSTALGQDDWLILAAIVTMYIVLGVLYESFIHPLTILSTLPAAGLGALLALRLAGQDLDIIGIVGILLLIGIVKKNAIMMIDFALSAERERGCTPEAAIHQAALLRLRPILMTTMAALLAALPLLLQGGMGSELRVPLGIALAGGLVVSQALTLFTTPVIYLAFSRLGRRLHAPHWSALRLGDAA
jgi:multidrug efflux pump